MAKKRVLQLLRERKFAALLKPPPGGTVFEASGVFAVGRACFVVFDNIRRAARVASNLQLDSPDHVWLGSARAGEGYEAITYRALFGGGTADGMAGKLSALIPKNKEPL